MWRIITQFVIIINFKISTQFANTTNANVHGYWRIDINKLGPRQNGRHFPDDIFKYIFLIENVWISHMNSLKCVPKVWISNIPALVQIMAWYRPGGKLLSERTNACLFIDAHARHSASMSYGVGVVVGWWWCGVGGVVVLVVGGGGGVGWGCIIRICTLWSHLTSNSQWSSRMLNRAAELSFMPVLYRPGMYNYCCLAVWHRSTSGFGSWKLKGVDER